MNKYLSRNHYCKKLNAILDDPIILNDKFVRTQKEMKKKNNNKKINSFS
tara:strand:- start:137 stop:283 length:147 start_codon:yes stop_codon:yes gene_type:complete